MTTTVTVLIEAKQAEAAQTTQYTSTNCKTAIDKFTAYNGSGANVTLTVNLVAPSGAAGAANITSSKIIPPGQEWPFPAIVGHTLENGGVISTIASAAGAVVIRASGRQFT